MGGATEDAPGAGVDAPPAGRRRRAWPLVAGALIGAGAVATLAVAWLGPSRGEASPHVTTAAVAPAPATEASTSPASATAVPAGTTATDESPSTRPVVDAAAAPPPPDGARPDWRVTSVVDGGTVQARDPAGAMVLVRLIGMDSPAVAQAGRAAECYGPESAMFAAATLAGQSVALEFDDGQGRLDAAGRTLAYVWLPDGRLYNWLAIAEGVASESAHDGPYRYQASFLAAQERARAAGEGLWSPAGCAGSRVSPPPTTAGLVAGDIDPARITGDAPASVPAVGRIGVPATPQGQAEPTTSNTGPTTTPVPGGRCAPGCSPHP